VGDLVKQYLQELPDSLICATLYDTFLAVEGQESSVANDMVVSDPLYLDLTDVTFKRETLKKIVNTLPMCHQGF